MKPARRFALALALAAAGSSFAQGNGAQVVNVSDAEQLVGAIASDRTIVLAKGDYALSTAYGIETDNATWKDGKDGKELSLSKLRNVTIRGADGARIVSGSSFASIVGIYDSRNVTFDDIRFVRQSSKGSEAGAGSLYAESVQGLTIDRCAFEGPTATAIELWECKDAAIKRTEISGTSSGALSASYTQGLELSSSRIEACEGYPLLYLENSDEVSFDGTAFEGSKGGNFIEIYSDSGSPESIRFDNCSFKGNQVDYFAGTRLLPATDACRFAENSFDEGWETDSVAPASDDSNNYGRNSGSDKGDSQTNPRYDHPSGLSFAYPQGWEMKEYAARSRVGVFAPDGRSLVFFLDAYAIPGKDAIPQSDPEDKVAGKVFAEAGAALAKLLKDDAGVALSLKADGEPYADGDLLSADYKGIATKGDGERAAARARFILNKGKVEAMVGLAADASSLEADGEIDGIFSSLGPTDDEGD
jgi:hypothetical protein